MSSDVADILERLKKKDAKALDLLPRFRTEEHKLLWTAAPDLYRAFAKKLITQGQPARGLELAREGLEVFPNDQYLLYYRAQATARGGNIAGAEKHLEVLRNQTIQPDTLHVDAVALQGRLWKMRFERERDPTRQVRFAEKSREKYLEAAALPGADTFPLINAATMSLMADRPDESKKLAAQVIDRLSQAPPPAADDYWFPATYGEAYLLLGDLDNAHKWYTQAVTLARAKREDGDIGSMRLNALLIKDKLKLPDDVVRLFYMGSVVVFAGHMIDHAGRGSSLGPRFPDDPDVIRDVEQAIDSLLKELNATIGICSAACGGDLLFAERMLLRPDCELHVVLPYAEEDFYKSSVDFGRTDGLWPEWRARCDRVLKRKATELHFATTEHHLGDDVLHELNAEYMQGLAILRSGQRGVEPQALVLRDPAAGQMPGGTTSFLARWKAGGLAAEEIDLGEIRRRYLEDPPEPPPPPPPAPPRPTARVVRSMLFADVKGFSTLSDPHLPDFYHEYLGEVRSLLSELAAQPVERNTWGDGLYLVFDSVGACAEAALRLLELGEKIEWKKFRLGPDVPLRIGVHTGPVFAGTCAIRDVSAFYGSQVTRAARIEPVTVPGCAFVSEQFAALLAVEEPKRFVSEYIGVESLAKEYGKCALYRLGRR